MSRITIPDYQEKQRLLSIDRTSARDLVAYGDGCFEAGRISDALDFYQSAKHTRGLEQIKEYAESAGDVMMFQHVIKALGKTIEPAAWDAIGRQALSLRKYAFSVHAFDKSGNAPMRDEVREIMRGDGQSR